MKAYIQTDEKGDYYNVNAFVAATGFYSLGFEVAKYHVAAQIPDLNPEHIVVGGVGNVRKRLELLGLWKGEAELEYPAELSKYLGRKVWLSDLATVYQSKARGIFIKPQSTKAFEGKVIREFKDFIGLDITQPIPVWCSEAVSFVTEWRCFVRYGKLLDVRRYKGAWDSKLDLNTVNNAIRDFQSSPAAYSLDFGVDEAGGQFLVEVNDGHSLGSYGIGAVSYAKFLSARWAERTGTEDYLKF